MTSSIKNSLEEPVIVKDGGRFIRVLQVLLDYCSYFSQSHRFKLLVVSMGVLLGPQEWEPI